MECSKCGRQKSRAYPCQYCRRQKGKAERAAKAAAANPQSETSDADAQALRFNNDVFKTYDAMKAALGTKTRKKIVLFSALSDSQAVYYTKKI